MSQLYISSIEMTEDEVEAKYVAGNESGYGYAVGADTAHVNDLSAELGELVCSARHNDDAAVYRTTSGQLVAVADIHGPWAVNIAG